MELIKVAGIAGYILVSGFILLMLVLAISEPGWFVILIIFLLAFAFVTK